MKTLRLWGMVCALLLLSGPVWAATAIELQQSDGTKSSWEGNGGVAKVEVVTGGSATQTTMHTAATSAVNGTALAVNNKGAAGLTVTGTFVGTVTFEGSADGGTTYSPITCTEIDTLVASQSTTVPGQWQCPIAGLSDLRGRISAYTSGSITVVGTSSSGSLGSAGGGGAVSGTVAIDQTTDGTTNGVHLTHLLECEDQDNDLCMVSGGATRQLIVVGGPAVAATDATSATWILPVGKKTFQAIETCTGTCTQIHNIYGSAKNAATTATAKLLCTIVLSDTTTATERCDVDTSYSYYFDVTSGTGGTSPLSTLYAMF